ncbi:unnamed protein product [Mytilus coruscus]|uniref:Uncharacterized protein n=1 Tax=Mytilus coruscus TaxID=42192 RepID=A0A6J8C2H3_MYTCO|nr:unnamed protein product [Mytilus coruscus]
MSYAKKETEDIKVPETTTKVFNTTRLNQLSDITSDVKTIACLQVCNTNNGSNTTENKEVSATGNGSNTKENKQVDDTTNGLNTSTNKEVDDTINGSNTSAYKEVANTTNGSNTSANKEVAGKTNGSNSSANKHVDDTTNDSNTTKDKEVVDTTNSSNSSAKKEVADTLKANKKVADTPNSSNTTANKEGADTPNGSNTRANKKVADTPNGSNTTANKEIVGTTNGLNSSTNMDAPDTTYGSNTTANKDEADTTNGSNTTGNKEVADTINGSNTTANKEEKGKTNGLNSSTNKDVPNTNNGSYTTANKDKADTTNGSNTTANREVADTLNGSNTSANKEVVDTTNVANTTANKEEAGTYNGSNTTANKEVADTTSSSSHHDGPNTREKAQVFNGVHNTKNNHASSTTNLAKTAECKIIPQARTPTLYTERARQKRDDQQNSKKTFLLKETRSQIDNADNTKRLEEIKEKEGIKEYESTEDALKTNSKCSTEHLQSLLCLVTKGLLVQSDNRFNLKSQVVNYSLPVDLQQPSLTDMQCEQKFQKIIDMQGLDDKVRSFGLDVSASAGTHLFKLDAPNSASEENDDETDKNETEIFLAIAKYAFVPVKSFHLLQDNMRLDATAIKDIQYIVQLIKELGSENQSVHEKSYDFLIRYGSHVSTGTHHVGGIFKMYTVCNDTTNTSHSKCLQTLRHEHALYVEAMMEIAVGEGSNSNSHVQRSHRETTNNESTLTVESMFTIFGGPLNAGNFRKWKDVLIQNPDTWTVIHPSEVTGIWNIILNHKQEISNCTNVAGLLKRIWEQNWGKSSNIKEVDNILIENLMSMLQEIDLIQNCNAETIIKLLKKCTFIAATNPKFEKYTKGGKWNEFLRKAVSLTEELNLESRFCLKFLLSIAEQRILHLDECLLTWFHKPLLCCTENFVENIKSFIQKDFRHVYASEIEISIDPYWRRQVEGQAVMEIARIICHYGKNLTDVKACISLAEIAMQLPFDFKNMKQKSQDSSCNTVDIFFSPMCRLRKENTSACGLKGLSQTLADFVSFIENNYFKTMEISTEIFLSVDQQQLQETIYDKMSTNCKDMLEKSFQVNKDFVKLALITVLWSDQNRSEYMKFCQRLEESKKVFHTGMILWCQNEKIEQLSCFEVLTFMPGFINIIKTYNLKDAQFEQMGIDCCLKLFKRFHEILFLNDLDDQSRKNCIEFAFILWKARKALSENGVFEVQTFLDIENLLTEMGKSIPKGSKSVRFVSKIPATEIDFLCEFRKVIIPTWRAMVDSLQTHKNYQIAVEHTNTYFVEQLEDLCDRSCQLGTSENRNDIRRKLGIFLSAATSTKAITWKNVEDIVEVGNNICRRII